LSVIPTEDALTLEARPPPEADFYDAFQKFKHAFNLLVRNLLSKSGSNFTIYHQAVFLPLWQST